MRAPSSFIAYHMQAIREAIGEFDLYIQRKIEEHKKLVSFMRHQNTLNLRQAELIDTARLDPHISYTVKTVRNTYDVVLQTARNDLEELVQMGLFARKRIGREFYYAPVADIQQKMADSTDEKQ